MQGDQLFVEFKGSLTENYVAQALKAALGSPLFYWTSEREAEVDFLIEYAGQIFPLEVRDRKELNCILYEERNVPDRVPGAEGISRAAKAEEPGARDGALQPSESVQVISLRSLKSGTSTKKKSLHVYNQKYDPPLLVRASLMNLIQNGKVCNYPLYFISRFPIQYR